MVLSDLSVVIPSLGGDLTDTIDSVNGGSVIPDEIVICLPNRDHSVVNCEKHSNIKIIYSKKYVYQRICGFKEAKSNYVLQLDDDYIVEKDCVELMLAAINKYKEDVAVSPYLKNIEDEKPFCPGMKSGFIMSLYYWLINGSKGFEPGGISLAGTEFCINLDDIESENEIVNIEWQPGGCVLHNKKNLVLDDYYPYSGKAYSEDLLHSYFLKKRGISLCVVLSAVAYLNINPGISITKELWSSFKVRLYYVRLADLSILRMLIYFSVYISKAAVKCIFSSVRKNS